MPRRTPHVYFRHDQPVQKSKLRLKVLAVFSGVLLVAGGYLFTLTQVPNVTKLPVASAIDLNKKDDAKDTRNRIQIEKLNLEVPFFSANTPASLEKGAWWRFPARGNPEIGGNFILSAHRFNLGVTPQGTKARSPFYNLNRLVVGDKIRIFYEGKWYDYEVTKNYPVSRNATEIEQQTVEPKLTLYTCSLKGEADGRVVIDAKPLFDNTSEKPLEEGSPLL